MSGHPSGTSLATASATAATTAEAGVGSSSGAASASGGLASLLRKQKTSTSSNASMTSVTDEPRGGFVLRAKSDDVGPQRRRSLVERTGMKTFVQVRIFIFY